LGAGVQISRLLLSIATCCLALFSHVGAAVSTPFNFRDGLIWVEVNLQGFGPANFLLDSGAGATLIDRDVAHSMKLRPGKARRIQGVSGTASAVTMYGIAGTLGSIAIPSSALALDLRSVSGNGPRIHGLLGLDFFKDRAVQIDYSSRVLRFLSDGESERLPGESVPLARRNDSFAIRVTVNGEGPQWMRFDTGCDSAVEWVTPKNSSSARGLTHAEVQMGTLTIPGVKVGRRATAFFQGEGGLVGNALLSKFSVTLDLARKRVVLASR
jgi:hypothetical protein